LRELDWMADGKGRHDWSQTALQLALLTNINRPKGKPAVSADEFNPYAERKSGTVKSMLGQIKPHLKQIEKKHGQR